MGAAVQRREKISDTGLRERGSSVRNGPAGEARARSKIARRNGEPREDRKTTTRPKRAAALGSGDTVGFVQSARPQKRARGSATVLPEGPLPSPGTRTATRPSPLSVPLSTRARRGRSSRRCQGLPEAQVVRTTAHDVPTRDRLRQPSHAEARGALSSVPPSLPFSSSNPVVAHVGSRLTIFLSRHQYSVLIMGLDNAGKTTFLGTYMRGGVRLSRANLVLT